MKIPGFLLRRLYVKGSLRNTPQGFQFQLKNSLGSGYARKLLPLTVDGREVPMDSSFFILDDRETPFSAVDKETPFTMAMNRVTTILVKGDSLEEGPRKIGMRFEVAGLGTLGFDFTDIPADA